MRIFLLLIITAHSAFAGSMEDGKQKASELVSGSQTFTPDNSVSLEDAVPSYTTSSPAETGYGSGNMSDAARTATQENNAAQFIKNSHDTRPEFIIDPNNSPIALKAQPIIDNPQSVVDSLTGRYGDCSAQTTTTTSSDIRTCDEYTEMSDQTCQVGQNVVVDAQHNYQCKRSRIYNNYNCNRTLSVTCAQQGCNAGAISNIYTTDFHNNVVSQNSSAVILGSYSYPSFNLNGSIPNPMNQGGSSQCFVKASYIHFTINDMSKLTKFTVTSATYTTNMYLDVNSSLPLYADMGSKFGNYSNCTNVGSSTKSLSLNLLPYLRQGDNRIGVALNTSEWNARAQITIDTAQQCCARWNESWSDNCGGYK